MVVEDPESPPIKTITAVAPPTMISPVGISGSPSSTKFNLLFTEPASALPSTFPSAKAPPEDRIKATQEYATEETKNLRFISITSPKNTQTSPTNQINDTQNHAVYKNTTQHRKNIKQQHRTTKKITGKILPPKDIPKKLPPRNI